MAYLSSVADAASADGSGDWFKVYQNSWSPTGGVGDNDNWGVKDMNACCGRVDVPIPADLPSGDYLLRAEVVALHTQPAQLYMTCYQLTIEGSEGGTLPAGVKFPGAYSGSDPGLTTNIHAQLSGYTAPGPDVVAGGLEVEAGSGCSGECEKNCAVGESPSSALEAAALPTGAAGGGSSCMVAKYEQCGGQGYTGCTNCAVSSPPGGFLEGFGLTNGSLGRRVILRTSTTTSVSRAGGDGSISVFCVEQSRNHHEIDLHRCCSPLVQTEPVKNSRCCKGSYHLGTILERYEVHHQRRHDFIFAHSR